MRSLASSSRFFVSSLLHQSPQNTTAAGMPIETEEKASAADRATILYKMKHSLHPTRRALSMMEAPSCASKSPLVVSVRSSEELYRVVAAVNTNLSGCRRTNLDLPTCASTFCRHGF